MQRHERKNKKWQRTAAVKLVCKLLIKTQTLLQIRALNYIYYFRMKKNW